MTGSLDQFVLIRASKSPGGEWSHDDYDVRDSLGKVGRIMRHSQARKGRPWFWTITAREMSPSVHFTGMQRAASRQWQISRCSGRPEFSCCVHNWIAKF